MYSVENYEGSDFQSVLDLAPHQHDEIVTQIRNLIRNGVISKEYNNFLTSIFNGKNPDSFSMSTFDIEGKTGDWRIARSKKSSLSIRLVEAEKNNKTHSFISANHITWYFLGNGSCDLEVFEFEEADTDYFCKTRKLISRKKLTLKNGDTLRLRRGLDGIYVKKIKGLAIVELSSFEHDNIIWNFEAETGCLEYASSADVPSSRLLIALMIIEKLGDIESLDIVLNIARNHKHHYVRWKAVETLASMGYEMMEDLIVEMTNDPHSEIRAAALNTLKINGVQ